MVCLWLVLLVVTWTLHGAAQPLAAPVVVVEQGRLRVDVSQVPFATVLASIGRQTGIEVRMDAAAARFPVTARLDRPLEDGLKELLRKLPAYLLLRDDAQDRVVKIIVFAASGQAQPLSSLPHPVPASDPLARLVGTIPTTPMSAEDRAVLLHSVLDTRDGNADARTLAERRAVRDSAVQRMLDVDGALGRILHGQAGAAPSLPSPPP
ncbi:MAG: hypothetical protein IT178_14710 [Acidobacteria bacterium]|nr:hypothetical protein [Acidobacteriota bacterium]